MRIFFLFPPPSSEEFGRRGFFFIRGVALAERGVDVSKLLHDASASPPPRAGQPIGLPFQLPFCGRMRVRAQVHLTPTAASPIVWSVRPGIAPPGVCRSYRRSRRFPPLSHKFFSFFVLSLAGRGSRR